MQLIHPGDANNFLRQKDLLIQEKPEIIRQGGAKKPANRGYAFSLISRRPFPTILPA